jgi:hypothetical protein
MKGLAITAVDAAALIALDRWLLRTALGSLFASPVLTVGLTGVVVLSSDLNTQLELKTGD